MSEISYITVTMDQGTSSSGIWVLLENSDPISSFRKTSSCCDTTDSTTFTHGISTPSCKQCTWKSHLWQWQTWISPILPWCCWVLELRYSEITQFLKDCKYVEDSAFCCQVLASIDFLLILDHNPTRPAEQKSTDHRWQSLTSTLLFLAAWHSYLIYLTLN